MIRPHVWLLLVLIACTRSEADPSKDRVAAEPSSKTESGAVPALPCSEGHERKGDACVDIDECSFVGSVCGTPLAQCANKPGGYECTCPLGYAGGGPLGIACTPRVVSGITTSCVLPESGGVKCWGARDGGVWHRDDPDNVTTKPEPIAFSENAVAIALGAEHACLLRRDTTVACWGFNKSGQRGDGTRESLVAGAYAIPGLTGVVQIASEARFSCAVLRGGELRCWGANYSGQLAQTGVEDALQPTTIKAGHVVQVALGTNHVCALRKDGTVTCWGGNERAQLGTGKVDGGMKVLPPAEISGLSNVAVLGDSAALLTTGEVVFWGLDVTHQKMLREELVGYVVRGPTRIPNVHGAIGLASGPHRTCALLTDGTVWCRGASFLGNGQRRGSTLEAVKVSSSDPALSIATAGDCLLGESNRAFCWGSNEFSRLGRSKREISVVPVPVEGT